MAKMTSSVTLLAFCFIALATRCTSDATLPDQVRLPEDDNSDAGQSGNTVYINSSGLRVRGQASDEESSDPKHLVDAEDVLSQQYADGDEDEDDSGETSSRRKRAALLGDRLWNDGIVIYTTEQADAALESADAQALIKRQLKRLERISCVRFVEYEAGIHETLGLPHRIVLSFIDDVGCSSFVGRLQPAHSNLYYQTISACGGVSVKHEIFHALGAHHEEQRSDSDTMYQINVNSINPTSLHNFNTKDSDNTVPFSFESFMHSSKTAFSNNGDDTFSVYDDDLRYLESASEGFVNFLDAQALNHLYECKDMKCPTFSLVCENHGYVGYVGGECKCVCPHGLMGGTCDQIYEPEDSLTWPDGDYTLPMPAAGCRTADIDTGARNQSLADNQYWRLGGDTSYFPENTVVDVKYFNHQFCSPSTAASNGVEWPKGSYCIYRHGGSCPTGFTSGSMAFDDADTENYNTHSGTLPDGVFNSDTTFYYCCRHDGHVKDEMVLPTDEPFMLLPGEFEETCQPVEGMTNIKGYYSLVTEGTTFTSPYPYFLESWRNQYNLHRYTFCYYEPNNYDCGGILSVDAATPSVTITSSASATENRNNKVCRWFVESPANKNMKIEFSNFNIPEDSNGACKGDYVEIRHFRITSPGEKNCGVQFPYTLTSYDNIVLIEQQVSKAKSTTAAFTATVTLIEDDDYVYDVTQQGKTYGGDVSYTEAYQTCLPWDEVAHCAYNMYNSVDGLLGFNNYCRNPSNAPRPWCYVSTNCYTDVCDVSGIGTCSDISSQCATYIANDASYCQTATDAFELCHNSCPFCGTGATARAADCGAAPTVANTQIVGTVQSTYSEGESVTYECLSGTTGTYTRTCLSDGTFSGYDVMCSACPDDYVEGSPGVCYKASGPDERLKYGAALAACEAEDGTLARASTADEQAAIIKALPIITNADKFTIGLKLNAATGAHEWIDGTALTYTAWAPASYQAGTQHVGLRYIPSEGTYLWDDINASAYSLRYVCQKNVTPLCPSGYTLAGDRCYKVVSIKQKRDDAQAACAAEGAQLARVFTQAEQDAINSVLPAGSSERHWIGLKNSAWLDGTTLATTGFTDWGNNAGSFACTAEKWYTSTGRYQWKTIRCSSKKFFVCDMETICVDHRADCSAIIAKHPNVCTDQEIFSRRVCRQSCNFC